VLDKNEEVERSVYLVEDKASSNGQLSSAPTGGAGRKVVLERITCHRTSVSSETIVVRLLARRFYRAAADPSDLTDYLPFSSRQMTLATRARTRTATCPSTCSRTSTTCSAWRTSPGEVGGEETDDDSTSVRDRASRVRRRATQPMTEKRAPLADAPSQRPALSLHTTLHFALLNDLMPLTT
jgi:hypothetical protein